MKKVFLTSGPFLEFHFCSPELPEVEGAYLLGAWFGPALECVKLAGCLEE